MNCACEVQDGKVVSMCAAHNAFVRGILDGERQRVVIVDREKRKAEVLALTDWTKKDGRSNASDQFEIIVRQVAVLIRGSAHSLISGDVESVSRLIVATLAHKHNFGPIGIAQ